ncbi:MAG TPA: hypothetical protein DCP28_24500 [Cytophagales bacterium]|nr:hypothetical protein [Cytophagales bacterium]
MAPLLTLEAPAFFNLTPAPSWVPTQETLVAAPTYTLVEPYASTSQTHLVPVEKTSTPWELILGVGYGLISAVLLIFSWMGHFRFRSRAKKNPRVNLGGSTLVLCDPDISPFTYLRYIFVSEKAYREGSLEEAILPHEQAHALQYHTLDIHWLRCLQALFWFNPVWFLYLRSARLNHEFLADASALQQNISTKRYRHLILDEIANRMVQSRSALTSPFHFQATHKRLDMMNKRTPSGRKRRKQISLLPVALVAVLLFANFQAAPLATSIPPETDIQDGPIGPMPQTNPAYTPGQLQNEYDGILSKYWKEETWPMIQAEGIAEEDQLQLLVLFQQMDSAQQARQIVGAYRRKDVIPACASPTPDQLKKWQVADRYGIWVDNKRIDNTQLRRYQPSDFAQFFVSLLHPTAKNYGDHEFQVDLMTKEYFEETYPSNPDAVQLTLKPPSTSRMVVPRA